MIQFSIRELKLGGTKEVKVLDKVYKNIMEILEKCDLKKYYQWGKILRRCKKLKLVSAGVFKDFPPHSGARPPAVGDGGWGGRGLGGAAARIARRRGERATVATVALPVRV